MKKILSVALIATICLSLVSCGGPSTFKGNEGVSKALVDSASQAIGVFLGVNVLPKEQYGELNYSLMYKTMIKMITDTSYAATANLQECQEAINAFMMKRQQVIAERNLQEGQAFLEKNKKAEGVIALENGLQYKILEEGSGIKPQITDTVEVHYVGTLIDGTEFDSSHKRGQTALFPLNGVVQGWGEGFTLLNEGSKAILYIPSDLGYGEYGSPPMIPGNAVMIFEVELIKVLPATPENN
jgi:FKBP-type peptidyl-prolyl cis-trans isomerases 1